MFYQSSHQLEHTKDASSSQITEKYFSERILSSALIACVKIGNYSAELPCEKMFSNGKNV